MKILVTGCAGFIGMHTSKKLLDLGHEVIGIDNLNDYYSPEFKQDRLEVLLAYSKFNFLKEDIASTKTFDKLKNHNFNAVIHLAAQAGVRYSFIQPDAYIQSNIIGTFNILEFCKDEKIQDLIFASSSSVYGNRDEGPFLEHDQTDNPVSLYAATKKSTEVLAHHYSYNFNLKCTGLRFFTVYGPWGRPDMAPLKFLNKIYKDEKIQIYHDGSLERDFTYIDDITEGIIKSLNNSLQSQAPIYKIFNIGSNHPYTVLEFVAAIEESINKKASKEFLPFQAGDVMKTYANVDSLIESTNYSPETSLKDGIKKLSEWFLDYKYFEKF